MSLSRDPDWKNQPSSSTTISSVVPSVKGLTKLRDVKPGEYVNFKARLVSFSFRQIRDKAGEKTIMSGFVEDNTSRTSLISHRIFDTIERDQVYLFRNAMVHEFPDSSVALILTEYSRLEERAQDERRDYYWNPSIGQINRAVWNVYLTGSVTRIYSTSGLVRRCNNCRQVIYANGCPKGCVKGWSWDLRVSFQLTDHTGSIRAVLARYSVAKLLGIKISELLFVANSAEMRSSSLLFARPDSGFSCVFEPPVKMQVNEIAIENATGLRSPETPLVVDGFNLIFIPVGSPFPLGIDRSNHYIRELDWKNDPQDARVLRKMVEKSLDIGIRASTKAPLVNGIYLLDSASPVYNCEKSKLYSGFKMSVRFSDQKLVADFYPDATILESVFDFVRWWRGRGATANALESALVDRRSTVLTAPSGKNGTIKGLIWSEAGTTVASNNDGRNLVDYWSQVYGIEIQPEETPLLKVQPFQSESVFTYPPSQVFFDQKSLPMPSEMKKTLEYRKNTASSRARIIIDTVVAGLKLGDTVLTRSDLSSSDTSNAEEMRLRIFNEIDDASMPRELGQEVR